MTVAEIMLQFGKFWMERDARRTDLKDKKEDYFIETLLDDLEAISQAIAALDNIFIQLIKDFLYLQYDDKGVMKVLEQTNDYLVRREILPKLKELKGTLDTLHSKPPKKVRKLLGKEFFSNLEQLNAKLSKYLDILGDDKVVTGQGREVLERLTYLVAQYGLSQDVFNIAQETLLEHDFGLSNEIHVLLGNLRFHVRTAKL
ncbi:MAG: hypothetical protein ACFFAY_03870 [Promethearchaeota archaeon]